MEARELYSRGIFICYNSLMTKPTSLKPWQVVSTTTIHQTPWTEILEDQCLTENNKQLTYTYARRVDAGPMMIAEEADGRLWLVRQYRHPIKKIIWQFPAEGKLSHETWEQAATRGLVEELQIAAKNLQDLGLVHLDPGGSDQAFHVFLATEIIPLSSFENSAHQDEVEDLEIGCFSRKEIDSLITSGEFCDSWSLSCLFLYDRYKQRAI